MSAHKKGRELERLVEVLERTLTNKDNVKIEPRKRLRDKRTGKLREFDVLMMVTQQHHTIIVGFECRDRSRKVSVGEVEAFHNKCLDCGVNQGVIVSSKGFWETARTKSLSYGIRCLEVLEAASFDWLMMGQGMESQHIKHVHTNLIFNPVSRVAVKPTKFKVFALNRTEIDPQVIAQNLRMQFLDKLLKGLKTGVHKVAEKVAVKDVFIKDDASGEEIPIHEIVAEFVVELETTTQPFTLLTYSEKNASGVISQVAKTPVAMGEIHGELMFVRKTDGTTEVLFAKSRSH